ncbi:MAG: hypothetical protein HY938_08205 [Nitrosomonadales bacterium]|nr:hypothetical protein [Nitrosomonadales bacterium]
MKCSRILFWALAFIPAFAAAAPHDILIPSVVPLNQNLAAVDYFKNGRQSGCGLRVTGETRDDIWLNVLITVFLKENGATFGVAKIVARKVEMKDGKPLLRDGSISYLDIGNIRSAWIKPDAEELPTTYERSGPAHSDAYMATVDFANTMDLLVAISRQSFKVGINRGGGKLDEIYQFDKGIGPDEAGKLSLCMKNLRAEIEEGRSRKSF